LSEQALSTEAAPATAQSTSSSLPYVALVAVIFAWGAGPVVTKLITVDAIVGVILRFGISVPVLFMIVHLRGSRVSMTTMRRAALPGMSFGINLIFVFRAVQEATVAVLAVATTLQPALILIAAGPMFDERPTRWHGAWTLVGVAGAAGVVLGAGSDLRASPVGIMFALLAVTTFTLYFVLTRLARSTTRVDPVEWMAAINLWALFALILPALFLVDADDFRAVDGKDWFWLAVLAYGTGVFGHVMMSWVHGYIEAARSSLALLTMNIVAVSLAWPVHDEPITATQGLAGLVVVGAVIAVLRRPARTASQPAPP
jgi:drug/metabolite transporter (DMT)-like permease